MEPPIVWLLFINITHNMKVAYDDIYDIISANLLKANEEEWTTEVFAEKIIKEISKMEYEDF